MTRLAVAVLAVLSIGSLASAQTPPATPSIVTHGQATVKRAPDQAFVAIAVESRAVTPADAQRQAADAMASVMAALARTSLSTDAVKTTGYSLQPDIEWVGGRQRVRGYVVRNQLEVRVDALDRLPAVLDAAGLSGATSIAGLRFDVKDRDRAERQALTLAVEDALARAAAIASGAKAALGPILRIDERTDRPVAAYMDTRAAVSVARDTAPTPVTPGEIEIVGRVELTIAIR
jgi:uncharacterized protein YggE